MNFERAFFRAKNTIKIDLFIWLIFNNFQYGRLEWTKSCQHDQFYQFVELQCGSVQAKILELQLISDAFTFLECTDPTEILQYNGDKLNDLKHDACLITHDGTCIILPGIIASFKTLRKRLLKKLEEDAKKAKHNNSNSLTQSHKPVVTQTKSIDEIRNHLITTINQWFINRRIDWWLPIWIFLSCWSEWPKEIYTQTDRKLVLFKK